MELADVTDSKSVDGDIVWVRVPPPAPNKDYNFDTISTEVIVLIFYLKALIFKFFMPSQVYVPKL